MKREKILFITPPYHCGVVEVAGRWIPLTFVYLSGAAKEAGFEPLIYDAMTLRHNHDDIKKMIMDINPQYVATTAITSTVSDALEILHNTKKINPSIKTIIGGVHPTFMYGEVLRNNYVDVVVRGEGEITIKELLIALKNDANLEEVKGIAFRSGAGLTVTPPRGFIDRLDSLTPCWDLIDWKHYRYFVIPKSRLGAISTSRGCNHNCTFCSQQRFWHQSWRAREPLNVVKEIELLYKRYGVNVFLITDEYPTHDRQRWEQFLDLLIEHKLNIHLLMETRAEDIIRDKDILYKYNKAGIIHVYIGVEATDQPTLDLIKKDINVETGIEALKLLNEYNMISETSFILGFPNETEDSIKRTLQLSKLYNPDFAHYLALAPWPYADMYEELKPYIKEYDYKKYNLIDPVIKPINMTMKDIDRAIVDCYQAFYMGKLKELLNIKDNFRRRYIFHSMKLIMNSSFIVEKLGSIGKIPPQVESLINKLQTPLETEMTSKDEEDFVVRVNASIYIDMPPHAVFDLVTDPANWPQFINGLEEVRLLNKEKVMTNAEFIWTYKIRGIKTTGKGKIVSMTGKEGFIIQTGSIFPIKEIIEFKPFGKGTNLSIKIGYIKGGKVVGFLFTLVKNLLNIIETTSILNNIKTFCEGEMKQKRKLIPSH